MEGESRWMGKQQQMQVNLFHLDQMVVTDQRGNLMHQEEVVGAEMSVCPPAGAWGFAAYVSGGGWAYLMGPFFL